MNHIAVVQEYHERTKHHPNRYAASLGYMDWATQPNPFRRYEGSEIISLPLTEAGSGPAYGELFQSLAPQSLTLHTLSQMLQYSLGLAAWKSIGSDAWALRCNASSGNLHPTEATVILPPIDGVSQHSIIAHYAPKEHALEILASFDSGFWSTLEQGSFLIGISSVLWREVWKYGERAFRYTQLDAGHAERAVMIAARLNGWHTMRVNSIAINDLDRLLGLDQPQRYHETEPEVSDMLLAVSPSQPPYEVDFSALLRDIPDSFSGNANQLSHSHHHWEVIPMISDATHCNTGVKDCRLGASRTIHNNNPATSIILKRRSAQAMDFGRTSIDRQAFDQLLASVKPDQICADEAAAHLVIFVHDVEGLASGLYLYSRNESALNRLKHLMRNDFIWECSGENLYLLEHGDFRSQAKFISCSQDIASDSSFSLGMLCEFAPQLESHGAHRYKELYWECGAIGQQLYLEATALNLSATGIGCYLDDVMHRMLGLSTEEYQVLYHFTIGRAIVDMRITTRPAYDTAK